MPHQSTPWRGVEFMLRDLLREKLDEAGFTADTEFLIKPRNRVDIAIFPNDRYDLFAFVEVKVEDGIRGVGQLLGYRNVYEPKPHCVLVVDHAGYAIQVHRACLEVGIELWMVSYGGWLHPIRGSRWLWDAFVGPDETKYELATREWLHSTRQFRKVHKYPTSDNTDRFERG